MNQSNDTNLKLTESDVFIEDHHERLIDLLLDEQMTDEMPPDLESAIFEQAYPKRHTIAWIGAIGTAAAAVLLIAIILASIIAKESTIQPANNTHTISATQKDNGYAPDKINTPKLKKMNLAMKTSTPKFKAHKPKMRMFKIKLQKPKFVNKGDNS